MGAKGVMFSSDWQERKNYLFLCMSSADSCAHQYIPSSTYILGFLFIESTEMLYYKIEFYFIG